jgi:hypothetical protein
LLFGRQLSVKFVRPARRKVTPLDGVQNFGHTTSTETTDALPEPLRLLFVLWHSETGAQ